MSQVKERKNSAWDRGVEALKAHGVSPSRTGADLRLAWNEMAYRARKYNDRRNQTGNETFLHVENNSFYIHVQYRN